MTPRTLAGRLTAWYAALLAVTLIGMAAIAIFVASQEDEAADSPTASLETPDLVPQRLASAFFVGLPPSIAFAIAGGIWITRRSLRPLGGVIEGAARLDAQRLDARLQVSPDAADEIGALSRTLNEMLDRIERSVESTRRFTADASHELRTPLAVLRTEMEVELRHPRTVDEMRESYVRALRELERLSRLVDALLTLARADAGSLALVQEPIDLSVVVLRASEDAAAAAAARRTAISVDADVAWIRGDPVLLARLVSNLVENAVKFAPDGGRVRISCRTRDGKSVLAVEDDGPGIDPAERARVFERFYRGTLHRGSTEGAGLGLSLVREIARRHGSAVELDTSPLGGLLARVSFDALDGV